MGATHLIDARYTNLFELVLARTVRATLTLLPVGRLAFDLVGYWKHPSAASILEPRDVATLLQDGSVSPGRTLSYNAGGRCMCRGG